MESVLMLVLGIGILAAGAEPLVRGASRIALGAGLSPLVVGLTVVAFGTSAPELVVSMKAALESQSAIAAGNIVGSNIFNIAAILGLSALVCPLSVQTGMVRRDMPVLLASSLLFSALLMLGSGLSRIDGGVLLLGMAGFLWWSVRLGRREADKTADEHPTGKKAVALPALLVVLGLVLLVAGARLFVGNAVLLARQLGMSEAAIGLTIVAAGTSLPELVTSLVAAFRRQTDIAIGNVVGSNIFNVLGIGGAVSLVAPIPSLAIGWIDLAFMAGLSLLLLPLMKTGRTLARWEGGLLVVGFGAYLFFVWP